MAARFVIIFFIFNLSVLKSTCGFTISLKSYSNDDNKRYSFERAETCCCTYSCNEMLLDCNKTCSIAYNICWSNSNFNICKFYGNETEYPIVYEYDMSQNLEGEVFIHILHQTPENYSYAIDYIVVPLKHVSINKCSNVSSYTSHFMTSNVAIAINACTNSNVSNTSATSSHQISTSSSQTSTSVQPSSTTGIQNHISSTPTVINVPTTCTMSNSSSSLLDSPCNLWIFLFMSVGVFSLVLFAVIFVICCIMAALHKSTKRTFTVSHTTDTTQADHYTIQNDTLYEHIPNSFASSVTSTSALIPSVDERVESERYVDSEFQRRLPTLHEVPVMTEQPYEVPIRTSAVFSIGEPAEVPSRSSRVNTK